MSRAGVKLVPKYQGAGHVSETVYFCFRLLKFCQLSLPLWLLSLSNGIICFLVTKMFFDKIQDNNVNCMKKQASKSHDCCVECFLRTVQKNINWSSYIISNINFMELMAWSKTDIIFIKLNNSNVLQHLQHKHNFRNGEVFPKA